jgi:activator of 2-hydroxyglutaryl-CoA dehydratase
VVATAILLRQDGGPSQFKTLLATHGETMHDHLKQEQKPQLFQIASAPAQKPHDHRTEFMVGLDVGSTTVKAVVVDAATDKGLWQDYQRHETKQPEKTLEFLRRIEKKSASIAITRACS